MLIHGSEKCEISSIEYNSKNVIPESLFVAVEGFSVDGHEHITEAVAKGAKAVVLSSRRVSEFCNLKEKGVVILASDNTRRSLSGISASFYQHPSTEVPVIGITGTNGKTTITYMLESILKTSGYSPAVIGTINYRWKDNEIQSLNTTPDSRDLQELIKNMVSDNIDFIIMEVSSHALKLHRVEDIDFNIAVFSNLTRDHLDFHESYDDYFNSKRKLFELVEKSSNKNRIGIINADDEFGRTLLKESIGFSYPMWSFGIQDDADYCPIESSIRNTIEGVCYSLKKPQKGLGIDLGVTGRFNVYNSLCAFAIAHRMGVPVEMIQRGLSAMNSVPGRFDKIRSDSGFYIIVDYAHTDDALLRLLQSVKELQPRRTITILGCGGNRDRTKRPLMGRVAISNSDWVIVTSDNPRDENPNEIIEDIIRGVNETNYEIEPDREEAIRIAIDMAERGDMIVIAGKGHENYQIIGDKRIYFDDHEVVRKYLGKRDGF